MAGRVVPLSVRSWLRGLDRRVRFDRRLRLDRAMRQLTLLPAGASPSDRLLAELQKAWGNADWTPRLTYLKAVAEHVVSGTGPVLECGTGLTTLLCAALAAKRGAEVWSLEDDAEWVRTCDAIIARYGLSNARLRFCPLRQYDGYTWYTVPDDLPGGIRLVICDGPAGNRQGGRYGVVPAIKDRLADRATILLDDAQRKPERDALARWSAEAGTRFTLHGTPPGVVAIVQYQAGAALAERLG